MESNLYLNQNCHLYRKTLFVCCCFFEFQLSWINIPDIILKAFAIDGNYIIYKFDKIGVRRFLNDLFIKIIFPISIFSLTFGI